MTKYFALIYLFLTLTTTWSEGSSPLDLNDNASQFLPVHEAFQFDANHEFGNHIEINISITPGYYLYKSRLTFSNTNTTILQEPPILPAGVKRFDTTLQQNVEVFTDDFTLKIPVKITNTPAALNLEFQGCSEDGLCYPPQKLNLAINTPNTPSKLPSLTSTIANQPDYNNENYYQEQLKSSSFLIVLLLFYLAGLGLSVTPCALPMIPIISSIIVGKYHLNTKRVFLLTTLFAFGMSGTLAIAGVITGLFGAGFNLQTHAQSIWMVIPTTIIFVILALSLFGLYDIQLPKIVRDLLGTKQTNSGSFPGAFLLGILSALVVSPCITAPLAGALIYISVTGDAILGGLALFILGLGMASPYFLLAFGGSKLLPKAGEWMNNIKILFGILLLALSIWTVERILPSSIALGLWGMFAICNGLLLGALDLPVQPPHQILQKTLGITLLIYGICAITGALSGYSQPLTPLANPNFSHTISNTDTTDKIKNTISEPSRLDQRLTQARIDQKPVLMYFTADWCLNCKTIDKEIMQNHLIRKKLENFIVIYFDITKNSREQRNLLKEYSLFGPPAFVFFDNKGIENKSAKLQGNITISRLTQTLNSLSF